MKVGEEITTYNNKGTNPEKVYLDGKRRRGMTYAYDISKRRPNS